MENAGLSIPLFYPFLAVFRLTILVATERLKWRLRHQIVATTVPFVLAALIVVGVTFYRAQPEKRFEQFLGVRPPASVTSIVYDQESRFLYSRITLTCLIDAEDAEKILKQPPHGVEITYDEETRRLTAVHVED
jgi:hypothetical protein